jgi:hypothetical protein
MALSSWTTVISMNVFVWMNLSHLVLFILSRQVILFCVRLSSLLADGEFTVLNYRITGDFRAPFRIYPAIEETGPYKLEVLCMIRAEMTEGSAGSNVVVNIPVPRATTR